MDPQKYTEDVFELFAVYIDVSVDINKKYVNGDNAKEIKGIAEEIRVLTKRLENGEIREAEDYVDRCLWSSFEAMIKLQAAYKTKGAGSEYKPHGNRGIYYTEEWVKNDLCRRNHITMIRLLEKKYKDFNNCICLTYLGYSLEIMDLLIKQLFLLIRIEEDIDMIRDIFEIERFWKNGKEQ